MANLSISDDISGNGAVVIDGAQGETVYYWLTIVPKPGSLIAEGSISGSEELMRKIKRRCRGGNNGTRWAKAFREWKPSLDDN